MPKSSSTLITIYLTAAHLLAAPASASEKPQASVCLPGNVSTVLATALKSKWNEGKVRAWEVRGEFLSMPLLNNLAAVSKALEPLKSDCDVTIADVGAYSARIIPKQDDKAVSKAESAKPNFISDQGTTLGLFAPSPDKSEKIIILYPASIAAAIARFEGKAGTLKKKNTLALISPQVDIEYNFGDVQIQILGGSGRVEMRKAADAIFRDLRDEGYNPMQQSEKAISQFDQLFAPDEHESFWHKKDGILRVELLKQKNGHVKVNIHETKQI